MYWHTRLCFILTQQWIVVADQLDTKRSDTSKALNSRMQKEAMKEARRDFLRMQKEAMKETLDRTLVKKTEEPLPIPPWMQKWLDEQVNFSE